RPRSPCFPTRRSSDLYSDWTLSMLQPNEEFYAEIDKISIYTNLIIILSILLAILISWLVYKTIASPLSYITQGMKHLEQGNLNRSEEHTSELQSRENI